MHPMLNTAIKAARKAGGIINKAALDPTKVQIFQKHKNDFVTNVDKECEYEIKNILFKAYPKHIILAEESTTKEELASILSCSKGYTWVVDPIDGTTNFIHDFPFYSISIALLLNGKVCQAVVYDPHRDELFIASEGRGSFLNSKRIRVSTHEELKASLITTGFPTRTINHFDFYNSKIPKLINNDVTLRRTGSAALDLCYVAAGRVDGFFEKGLQAWDIAAGSLIVREAGGYVSDLDSKDNYLLNGEVIASNPKLFPSILKLIN